MFAGYHKNKSGTYFLRHGVHFDAGMHHCPCFRKTYRVLFYLASCYIYFCFYCRRIFVPIALKNKKLSWCWQTRATWL